MGRNGQELSNMKIIEIFDNDTLAAAICFLRSHGTFSETGTRLNPRPAIKADSPPLQISLAFSSHAGFLEATMVEDFVHALNDTSIPVEELRYIFDSRFWEQANSAHHHGPKLKNQVYDGIGRLPHLRSLHWVGNGDFVPDCQLQLARALKGAKNLVRLRCADIIFYAADYGFDAFLMELQNHPTLSELAFADCCIITGYVSQVKETKWGAFFDALSSIINLRKLTLSFSFLEQFDGSPSHQPSTRAFASLCAHPKLEILDISSLGRNVVPSAWQGIRRNSSLSDLTLSTQLQETELLLLGTMVRTQKSLKKLIINVKEFEDDQPMTHLISALEVNLTLTDMKFQFQFQFGFGVQFFSNGIQDAMVVLLEKRNYTLRSITFDLPLCSKVRNLQTEEMLEYYLCLNRFGRKTFLENLTSTDKEQWVSALICARESLDALHYFLSLNPTMIEHN